MNFYCLIILNCLLVSNFAKANQLYVEEICSHVTCLRDKSDREASNSFLILQDGETILIDSGWSRDAFPPPNLKVSIEDSVKVATHFHFDHIRRWGSMNRIWLSTSQANRCSLKKCSPSYLDSVYAIDSFSIDHIYLDGQLVAGLETIACGGHSRVDSCFLHSESKTLFLGDIFYPGPVYAFLPGGSIDVLKATVESVLQNPRWEYLALPHGNCLARRRDILKFASAIGAISSGGASWHWNFDFWIPLKSYVFESGSIISSPFW